MKRHIRLIAVTLTVALFFAGCSGDSAPGSQATQSGASSAPAQTSAASNGSASAQEVGSSDVHDWSQNITLSVLPQCDEPVDPQSPVTEAIEEMFNVTLDYWYLDRTNMNELLAVRMASGEIPDLFSAANQTFYKDYHDQGVLAEIPRDLLETVSPNFYQLTVDAFKSLGNVWDLITIDEKVYGIPIGSVTGAYTTPNLWRGDWLTAVGIDKIPTTIEEAEAAFYAFAKEDPDGNGKDDTYAISKFGMDRWLWSFGGTGITYVLDQNDNVTINLLTDEFKEGFAKLVQFYKDGLIDPEFITGENKGQYWASSIAFWNGLIGFTAPGNFYHVNPSIIEGDGGSSVNSIGFANQNPGLFYDYGKMLQGPKTYAPVGGAYPGGMKVVGMQVDQPKMERILLIFDRICSDYEGAWTLAEWGIEGVTFELSYDKDGLPIYTRIGQFAAGNDDPYDPGLKGNGINLIESSCYDFCKRGEAQLYAWGDANATAEALGAPDYVNPCYGVLSGDALTIRTNVTTKYDEAYNLFITGQRDFSAEWDKFIGDELETIGLSKWLDEANAWYQGNKK
ncbi:MAG: hypothetical protein ACOX8S_12400 [Christensenellales bacterium]|jgi:putative aldouronate transport system substrate-binding protein